MEYFRRILFGTSYGFIKPTIGTISNELGDIEELGVYANKPTSSPFNYSAFVNFNEAQAYDGAIIELAEIYVNDQYFETFLITNPNTQIQTFYNNIIAQMGESRIKARVKDNIGLFSDFSNEIIYDLKPPADVNYLLKGPIFYPEVSLDPNIFKYKLKIHEWKSYTNSVNSNDSSFLIKFEFDNNPGTTGEVVLTLYGQGSTQETFILECSTPMVISIPMNNLNPNRKNMWSKTGLLGVKVEKVGVTPGTTVNVIVKVLSNIQYLPIDADITI